MLLFPDANGFVFEFIIQASGRVRSIITLEVIYKIVNVILSIAFIHRVFEAIDRALSNYMSAGVHRFLGSRHVAGLCDLLLGERGGLGLLSGLHCGGIEHIPLLVVVLGQDNGVLILICLFGEKRIHRKAPSVM